jgi:hypothetical protein
MSQSTYGLKLEDNIHEEKVIMNLNTHRLWGIWDGGFFRLLLKGASDLTPTMGHISHFCSYSWLTQLFVS